MSIVLTSVGRSGPKSLARRSTAGGPCFDSIFSALSVLLLALILVVTVVPKLLGASSYVVASGSMVPALNVGDVSVVKETNASEITYGDIITFQMESGRPEVATHRVVGVGQTSGGEYSFATKGDANNVADLDLVTEQQIRGKVIYSIPKIGWLSTLVSGKAKEVGLLVLAVGLLGYGAVNLLRPTGSRPKTNPIQVSGSGASSTPAPELKETSKNAVLRTTATETGSQESVEVSVGTLLPRDATNSFMGAPFSNIDVQQAIDRAALVRRHSNLYGSEPELTNPRHRGLPKHRSVVDSTLLNSGVVEYSVKENSVHNKSALDNSALDNSALDKSLTRHQSSPTTIDAGTIDLPTRSTREIALTYPVAVLLCVGILTGMALAGSSKAQATESMPDHPLAYSSTGQTWQTDPLTNVIPPSRIFSPGDVFEAPIYIRNLTGQALSNTFTAEITGAGSGVVAPLVVAQVTLPTTINATVRLEPYETKSFTVRIHFPATSRNIQPMSTSSVVSLKAVSTIATSTPTPTQTPTPTATPTQTLSPSPTQSLSPSPTQAPSTTPAQPKPSVSVSSGPSTSGSPQPQPSPQPSQVSANPQPSGWLKQTGARNLLVLAAIALSLGSCGIVLLLKRREPN